MPGGWRVPSARPLSLVAAQRPMFIDAGEALASSLDRTVDFGCDFALSTQYQSLRCCKRRARKILEHRDVAMVAG